MPICRAFVILIILSISFANAFSPPTLDSCVEFIGIMQDYSGGEGLKCAA